MPNRRLNIPGNNGRSAGMKQQERNMERLKGKSVLITGASSGIGQAIAIRFAREGANVAINYRSGPDQAAATEVMVRSASVNGFRTLLVQADIAKEDDVKSMFSKVIENFGSIDVLVN